MLRKSLPILNPSHSFIAALDRKYVCWNNTRSLCKIRYNDYDSDEKETCYGRSYTSKIRSKSDSLYKKLSINAEKFTRKRETCLRLGKRNIYQCQENSLCRCSKKNILHFENFHQNRMRQKAWKVMLRIIGVSNQTVAVQDVIF